jgi:beta-glucosidase
MHKNYNKIVHSLVALIMVLSLTMAVFAKEQVATPTFRLQPGVYEGTQTIYLNCATPGAQIYYTLNGDAPSTSSILYSGRFLVKTNTVIKAIAFKDGMTDSDMSSCEYKIKALKPYSQPGPGVQKSGPLNVALLSSAGTSLYYTTDGTIPTTSSNLYTKPITINKATTLKVLATKNDMENSEIATLNYSFDPNLVVLTDAKSIPVVIKEMSLEEKAKLVCGAGLSRNITDVGAAGNTYAIQRLRITSMELCDGPAGVRLDSKYATAWPNPMLAASTWNTEILGKIGKATADEAKYYGIDLMLSPGMNIHRNPLGGRVYEYFSEDPYLTGKLASAYIKEMQENGVGATLKHYAANNAENSRMGINEIISERTLREIYFPVWEIAVKDAKPWAAMSAYNKVNGVFCSENKYLNKVIKEEFGFDGLIMSDWGAYQGPQAFTAGFDLDTPGGPTEYNHLVKAVNDGLIKESALDRAVAKILGVVIRTDTFKKQIYDKSAFIAKKNLSAELKVVGAKLSKEAALEGMVLLKNNNILPLSSNITVGLAGKNAVPIFVKSIGDSFTSHLPPSKGLIIEGGGSACVNIDPDEVVSMIQGLENGGLRVVNKNANGLDLVEGLSEADAAYVATNSNVGIISIGRAGQEGVDVKSIEITEPEKDLMKKFSDAYHAIGKKVIVLLNIAQPIEVASWEKYADAILYVGLPGTYGANAITDILIGKVNPSGKLSDTWPVKYSDLSTATNMPMPGQKEIEYKERIYVGYRYFDTKGIAPMYPFGYGMSYTTFKFSDLKLSSTFFRNKITLTVNVTNTGKMAGKEVVQLYLSAPATQLDKPDQELKGFIKTKLLAPGETQKLTFTLDKRALASFDDESKKAWVADAGKYQVKLGPSSRDIKLRVFFSLNEELILK